VLATDGSARVSVTRYLLQNAYRPAMFAAVTRELDQVAAKLAAQSGEQVTQRETIEVAGRKIRAYRLGARRIGFVLVGMHEYQLLCEGQDPGGACALLFKSFSVP
jgi:hypothetical protein